MEEEDVWELAVVIRGAATHSLDKWPGAFAWHLGRAGRRVKDWETKDIVDLINRIGGRDMEAPALYLGIVTGHRMQLKDVGDYYGVTRQRAQQLIFDGLDKFEKRATRDNTKRRKKAKEKWKRKTRSTRKSSRRP